jgi:hypothetical protein
MCILIALTTASHAPAAPSFSLLVELLLDKLRIAAHAISQASAFVMCDLRASTTSLHPPVKPNLSLLEKLLARIPIFSQAFATSLESNLQALRLVTAAQHSSFVGRFNELEGEAEAESGAESEAEDEAEELEDKVSEEGGTGGMAGMGVSSFPMVLIAISHTCLLYEWFAHLSRVRTLCKRGVRDSIRVNLSLLAVVRDRLRIAEHAY